MNEHMPLDAQQRKLLSAFMDGQAEAVPTWDEGESGQLCECWHLYHLIGDVLRTPELAACTGDAAFLVHLRERLMQEDAPPRPAAAPSLETVLTAAHTAANNSAFSWRVLLAAASLAAVALIAWEVATPGAHPGAQIAQRQPAPQPAAPLQNTTPVLSAALPASAEQAPVIAGAMLRDPYLDNLLAAHRQAAGASGLGAASGFLRNATFEGDAR